MPVILNPKLTDAGKAAAVNANANGLQLGITHIALGTGKYDSAAVGAGMTAMAGRKEQVQVGAGLVTGAGGFRIHIRFEGWTGTPNPYNATELGFYAGDPAAGGVLFAVFSHPSDVIVQRNSLDYVASFNLQITDVPPGSVTVVVNPDTVELLALLSLHENATNPHTGYVRKIGDTSTGPQLGVTAPQHDNGKAFATTEFAKRMGLSYPASGGLSFGVNTTLTAANMGQWGTVAAAGVAVTLPLAADVPVGASFKLLVSALSGLLLTQGTDVLTSPGFGNVQRLQVIQGETITVTRNEAGTWWVTGAGFRMQAGTVSFFAGSAAPPGWLKLNGATLSRAGYPALWLYAQSQGVVTDADWNAGFSGRFSSGVAGNDFRIPDARGTFLRALDDGRGLDPSRGWGTYQDHANRSHNHTITDPGHTHSLWDGGHTHVAWTDAQGSHTHGVNDPGHSHSGLVVGQLAAFGALEEGRGPPDYLVTNIGASGTGISLQWANAHGHNVGVGAANANIGVYANASGITIQPDGSEARPRNLAWALCIKF